MSFRINRTDSRSNFRNGSIYTSCSRAASSVATTASKAVNSLKNFFRSTARATTLKSQRSPAEPAIPLQPMQHSAPEIVPAQIRPRSMDFLRRQLYEKVYPLK